ncbi:MAG TPA: DUF58 domain-containing protein [Phycisphaerae bacterium]|nr:DUF58 domain-containing protein [Phycisphaerae bacterium]
MARAKQRHRYLDPEVLQRIGSLDLIAREVVEGMRVGMHKSPLRGFSTEFSQHRQYVQGDPLRHVDWRVYGRTDRYYLKLYEAETNFTANLLLDASRSMHYASGSVSKLEYAKYMAASLAYLIGEQRDSVGLAVFDDHLREYVEPSGSRAAILTIAEQLEKVSPEPRTNVAGILHEFARRMRRRGFVILFSDLFDHVEEFLKGLDHLRFGGHNVTVFHTLDPFELEFPFGGTCKFKGLELDGEVSTQPRRIREAYMAELRQFIEQVKGACERSHIDYVLVDTSRPVDVVLLNYLIQRIRSTGKKV